MTPGSRVITEGWPSYLGLTAAGYVHERQVIRDSGEPADTLLPRGPSRRVAPQEMVAGDPSGTA